MISSPKQTFVAKTMLEPGTLLWKCLSSGHRSDSLPEKCTFCICGVILKLGLETLKKQRCVARDFVWLHFVISFQGGSFGQKRAVCPGPRCSQGTLGGGEVPDPVWLEHGWAAAGSVQEEPRNPAGPDCCCQHGLHRGRTCSAPAGREAKGWSFPAHSPKNVWRWSPEFFCPALPPHPIPVFTNPLANPVGRVSVQERKHNKPLSFQDRLLE